MTCLEAERAAVLDSIWAPPGALFIFNVSCPIVRQEFESAKRAFGVPTVYPMGDMQRTVWEADLLRRVIAKGKAIIPLHVQFRMKAPPYREFLEGEEEAFSPSVADKPQQIRYAVEEDGIGDAEND